MPGGIADCGEGYDFAVTNDGRLPGCDEERLRPIPRLAMVLAHKCSSEARRGFGSLIEGRDSAREGPLKVQKKIKVICQRSCVSRLASWNIGFVQILTRIICRLPSILL